MTLACGMYEMVGN